MIDASRVKRVRAFEFSVRLKTRNVLEADGTLILKLCSGDFRGGGQQVDGLLTILIVSVFLGGVFERLFESLHENVEFILVVLMELIAEHDRNIVKTNLQTRNRLCVKAL